MGFIIFTGITPKSVREFTKIIVHPRRGDISLVNPVEKRHTPPGQTPRTGTHTLTRKHPTRARRAAPDTGQGKGRPPMGDDPVRDKYTHAINWDYASHDPQILRLREQLAREYDAANGIMIPLDPEDTMPAFREIVRLVLDGLAARNLVARPDLAYKAMFPFPDTPGYADLVILDAVTQTLGRHGDEGER